MFWSLSWITMLFLWILILSSILIIVIPLIDNILNSEFLWYFNDVIFELNTYIWSNSVNYILVILWLIFFLYFLRFIFKKISPVWK